MKVYRLPSSPAPRPHNDANQPYPNVSEAQIWINFKNGSEEAYHYIYDTYFPVLYNYGRQFCPNKEQVKDCIQDVFITLWQSRERLGVTDSIKYYLFKALKRSIARSVKKAHRYNHLVAQVRPFDNVPSIEEHIILSQAEDEKKNRVRQAVNALSDKQREAIFLLFYENLSYPQMADLLSVEVKTAHNLVSKALQSLRRHLKLPFYLIYLVLLHWLSN